PENHPLALGAGGVTYSKQIAHFLTAADVIFGIGCSFATTTFGIPMPAGKRYIHATLDPTDIDKDLRSDMSLVGDAALTLDALCAEVADRLKTMKRAPTGETAKAVQRVKAEWLGEWAGALNSESKPLSPYRVIRDLMRTLDPARCIVTHDAGSPRNQIVPFWETTEPMTYLGWGKSTQLGYGLGLAMGAKLARPDMMCVNVWGDAAIGFTGMDLETAAREGLPILSVLFNNSTMAIEHRWMPTATEKYRSTDVTGDYTMFARSMGCWAERVEEPGEIVPAIQRAVRAIEEGKPALLEFITEYSSPASMYR
ncbi:MAG TPA: thiamine pyrophosphate-dependent enzyme, partial [Sphingomonadaceae bacterium]|nr:thiamine pyrophosphate-dependent enzyme [Sphingomonadaceae bacterium]